MERSENAIKEINNFLRSPIPELEPDFLKRMSYKNKKWFVSLRMKSGFVAMIKLPKIQQKFLTGFTLIEMLVSVSIIALITSLFLANYHATSGTELTLTTQKMASDIRMAEDFSLGEKDFNASAPASGGWGIHFDVGSYSYYIFADMNNNHNYDAGELYKKIDLPDGETINRITVGGSDVSFADITFFPPDPDVYINDATGTSAIIYVMGSKNNQQMKKNVNVNFLGTVDVN